VEEYAADLKKFEAVLFKPRGWSWIDPTKEVEAYRAAIKAGIMTLSDVIAITGEGKDLEDVLRQRKRELQMMEDKGLVFDTSPEVYVKEEAPAAAPAPEPAAEDPPKPDDKQESKTDDPPKRVVPFLR